MEWQPIETAPFDDEPIEILACGMSVYARFCPGEINRRIDGDEYDSSVWSCFDDMFQFEIEESSSKPSEMGHYPVTHWRRIGPLPSRTV